MRRPRVYLSGSLQGRRYRDCLEERKKAAELLSRYGIEVIDPLRCGGRNVYGEFIDEGIYDALGGLGAIIARDKADIARSDLILILTGDTPTDGTWLEYGYAIYKVGIPAVLVAPSLLKGKSWSVHEAAYIAPDIEDAVRWIGEYFFAGWNTGGRWDDAEEA